MKGSTFDLEALVRKFTQLCVDKDHPCHVFNFYELQMTSLPSKVFPWLPAWCRQEKLVRIVKLPSFLMLLLTLVSWSIDLRRRLDIVRDPLPLDRPHVLTNKFDNPECPEYKKVTGKIQDILMKTRKGTLLAQADAWIRDNHYSADKLKIERLSR